MMQIVQQPDIFLREPTSEVKLPLSPEDQVIIDLMIATMYKNNGIGLAANQVGYARLFFVMDTSTDHNNPKNFIKSNILGVYNLLVAVNKYSKKKKIKKDNF